MFTMVNSQIAGVLIASTLYALLISWGPIRDIDDDREWRWLITSGGVAIVVIIATVNGPATLLDLLVCFGVSSVPIWVRAAIFRNSDRNRRAITEAYRAAGNVQEAA